MDFSPPGSSVHRIISARMLEWFATSSCRGSSWSRDQTCISCVSCIGKWATWEVCNHDRGPWYTTDPCFSKCSCWTTSMIFTWKFVRNAKSRVSYLVVSDTLQPCGTVAPWPGSSVHGILQARILEWVAILFSRGSSQRRDQTWISHIAGIPSEPPGKMAKCKFRGPTPNLLSQYWVKPKWIQRTLMFENHWSRWYQEYTLVFTSVLKRSPGTIPWNAHAV